uniref:Uncharacterized protein n=1 Tax=Arion vulgaris TaxID=1028688 RepID=A0A0B7ADA1_9EUPU
MAQAKELSQVGIADEGTYETEVCVAGRIELPRIKDVCAKNPDHREFIYVDDLSLHHLPEKYQKDNILEMIKLYSALTVCLFVECTSNSRPLTFPDSKKSYPFFSLRGTTATRTGTGSIELIHEYNQDTTNKRCYCEECKVSGDPKTEWGKIIIQTGKHVVFNEEEGEKTVIEIFYDSEKRDKVHKLQGHVKDTDIKTDWCLIYCPTHNMELVTMLQLKQHAFAELRKELYQQYRLEKPNLVVIASHPHGCCKHISIGRLTDREIIGDSKYTRYSYTTATCPGCSGARVWILAEFEECRWACHIHSEAFLSGVNRSGVGWY